MKDLVIGVVPPNPDATGRSIDIDSCTHRQVAIRRNRVFCACKPVCAMCGFRKHTAIHGPLAGQPVGSQPWDHEYTPTRALKNEEKS